MRKKPVLRVSVEDMWNYEYQAKNGITGEIFASDSLGNLKRHIREETWWSLAWLTASSGCLSYGQYACDEYPYAPRR